MLSGYSGRIDCRPASDTRSATCGLVVSAVMRVTSICQRPREGRSQPNWRKKLSRFFAETSSVTTSDQAPPVSGRWRMRIETLRARRAPRSDASNRPEPKAKIRLTEAASPAVQRMTGVETAGSPGITSPAESRGSGRTSSTPTGSSITWRG